MDEKNHLDSLIDKSSLNDQDKSSWRNIVASVPNIYIQQLVYFIEQVPQGLEWLNQNLKDKIEVLKQKDKTAWQSFLNKEKEDIVSLLNKQ